MKSIFIAASAAALLLASCAGKDTNKTESPATAQADTVVTPSVVGQWCIDDVVVSDSVYARPSEIDADVRQTITFNADSTYYISTNCNSISGPYVQNGDSITLGAGLTTEMACENMQVEDLLKQVLPAIRTIDIENDSVARLNSESGMYIVLRRQAAE